MPPVFDDRLFHLVVRCRDDDGLSAPPQGTNPPALDLRRELHALVYCPHPFQRDADPRRALRFFMRGPVAAAVGDFLQEPFPAAEGSGRLVVLPPRQILRLQPPGNRAYPHLYPPHDVTGILLLLPPASDRLPPVEAPGQCLGGVARPGPRSCRNGDRTCLLQDKEGQAPLVLARRPGLARCRKMAVGRYPDSGRDASYPPAHERILCSRGPSRCH